jgi:hypothetical protein
LPEDLVGEQVPDPGDHPLIHEARLDRRAAAAYPPAEVRAGDHGGVGTEPAQIRLQARASQAPLVAQGEAPTVLKGEGEPIPALVGLLVDGDAARHPKMEPELGPIAVGLEPQCLTDPVRARQPAPGQRGGDLTGPVRSGDVAVIVLDGGDPASQRPLRDQGAGALGLRELGHAPKPTPRVRV